MSPEAITPVTYAAYALLLACVVVFVLGHIAFTAPAVIFVWAPALLAGALAILLGVPAWRDEPFGDAFDICFLVALVNAFALRFAVRWFA